VVALVLALGALGAGCGGSDDQASAENSPPAGGSGGQAGGAESGGAGGVAGGGGGQAGGSGGMAGGGAAGDPGAGGAAGAAAATLAIGATQSSLALPFQIDAVGQGTKLLGAIKLAGNTGTIELEGQTRPVVAYQHQAWPSAGYDLYQLISVGPDRFDLFWLYCTTDQKLSWVYFESTDGTPVTYEQTTGTCAPGAAGLTVTVDFPAVSMPLPKPVSGFSVKGDHLDLGGETPGWLEENGVRYSAIPFNSVDCTTACGTPGWWELHTLLWNQDLGTASVGILYLFEGGTSEALTYSLSFPDLGMGGVTTPFMGPWTATK
jgi:hypothetical protein